jgi:hypothetical protein
LCQHSLQLFPSPEVLIIISTSKIRGKVKKKFVSNLRKRQRLNLDKILLMGLVQTLVKSKVFAGGTPDLAPKDMGVVSSFLSKF